MVGCDPLLRDRMILIVTAHDPEVITNDHIIARRKLSALNEHCFYLLFRKSENVYFVL